MTKLAITVTSLSTQKEIGKSLQTMDEFIHLLLSIKRDIRVCTEAKHTLLNDKPYSYSCNSKEQGAVKITARVFLGDQ